MREMGLDKAKGMLYGLAIGDALGYRVEIMSLSSMKAKYGEKGIRHLPEPALFSDDTQMGIATAGALIRSGEKHVGEIDWALERIEKVFTEE